MIPTIELTGVHLLLALLLLLALPVPLLLQIRHLRRQVAHWKAELRRTLETLNADQYRAVVDARHRPRPLAAPPTGVRPTLHRLHERYPTDPYALALGWEEVQGEGDIVAVSLHGDSPIKIGHMLLTGETDSGKDTCAFLLAAALCTRATPAELRIFWLDGKRADGALWRGKAHNWRAPALGPDSVPAAMAALHAEREQREQAIVQAGVTRWEELPTAQRPPLLWVYVSELELLALGTANLEHWLRAELSAARASGIRYCIASQTVSGKSTTWRSQISCYVAGCQSTRAADGPNIGLTAEEIRERGALLPSDLPGAGYFSVRVRKDVATVRVPWISLDDRRSLLAALPAATEESAAPPSAPTPAVSPVSPPADQPAWAAEQQVEVRGLLLADNKNDRQIIAAVFGVRSGPAYWAHKERLLALRRELEQEARAALRVEA